MLVKDYHSTLRDTPGERSSLSLAVSLSFTCVKVEKKHQFVIKTTVVAQISLVEKCNVY
jgi:hypothetical protein